MNVNQALDRLKGGDAGDRAIAAAVEAEIERLRDAAQAVVDRWHTPLWKDVEATGAFINRLEAALAPDAPVNQSLTTRETKET